MKIFKILGGAAVVGALVFGASAPAFAHHATLTHAVTCDTATYTYTVTLNVANSEGDKVMTITNAHGNPIVANGDTVDKGATRTYTLSNVPAPIEGDVTLDVAWPNGVTGTYTDKLVLADFPECIPPVVVPPVDEPPVVVPPVEQPPVVTPPVEQPPVTKTTPVTEELAHTGPVEDLIRNLLLGGVGLLTGGLVLQGIKHARRS